MAVYTLISGKWFSWAKIKKKKKKIQASGEIIYGSGKN